MERMAVFLLAVFMASTTLGIDPDVEVFDVKDTMLNYGITLIKLDCLEERKGFKSK